MSPKLEAGDISVHGYAQEMADGAWQARCCITEHLADESRDHLLQGPTFAAKAEAVTHGIHMGIAWVNAKYPLD